MNRSWNVAVTCAVALLACVPATEEAEPRGAGGFSTAPSPASSGVAFATRDGYTMVVERLVVFGRASSNSDGSYEPGVLFPATSRVDLFVRGLKVGKQGIAVDSFGLYLRDIPRGSDDPEERDVTPEESKRFRQPAEVVVIKGSAFPVGPVALLIARAERSGRTWRMNVTIEASSGRSNFTEVEVRANSLTTVPLTVAAENLFSVGTTEPLFGSFARSDSNADGIITPDELQAGLPTVRERDDPKLTRNRPTTLAALLSARASEHLLVR